MVSDFSIPLIETPKLVHHFASAPLETLFSLASTILYAVEGNLSDKNVENLPMLKANDLFCLLLILKYCVFSVSCSKNIIIFFLF